MKLTAIFGSFFKIGIFGFVRGPAMVPLLQEELVEGRRWMDMEEFASALAFVNAIPGPLVTKMAFWVGYRIAGVPGAFSGLAGILFPSTILLIIPLYLHLRDSHHIESALKAAKPVPVSFLAGYELFRPSIKGWDTGLIAIPALGIVWGEDDLLVTSRLSSRPH